MTLYKCKCGKEEREVTKAKIVLREGKWVADVICSCNKYMDSEPTEGMPSLKRTEPTLSNKDDMLWDKAKEQL
jgi:hypothetical protein